jgi:hypothetical protein
VRSYRDGEGEPAPRVVLPVVLALAVEGGLPAAVIGEIESGPRARVDVVDDVRLIRGERILRADVAAEEVSVVR